jgi:hypothetical protein
MIRTFHALSLKTENPALARPAQQIVRDQSLPNATPYDWRLSRLLLKQSVTLFARGIAARASAEKAASFTIRTNRSDRAAFE